MRLVIIESPCKGDYEHNLRYAKRCVRDSLILGDAPIAFHLLYAQPGILDDMIPKERTLGIRAGIEWYRRADVCRVYTDYGISSGMRQGIEFADRNHIKIEYTSIGKNKEDLC